MNSIKILAAVAALGLFATPVPNAKFLHQVRRSMLGGVSVLKCD